MISAARAGRVAFARRLADLAFLIGLAGCSNGGQQEACSTEHVASLPTRQAVGYLAVPVEIDEKPTVLLVDTGAQTSMIADGQDRALKLRRDQHRTTNLVGTGGGRVKVANVLVSGIRFGDRETGEVSLPVGSLPGPLTAVEPPIAGLLGLDVLQPYDIDIDRPRNTVGLYLRTGCDFDLPDWTGRAVRIPLARTTNNLLLMPVFIDGIRLDAVIDTGSRRTVVSRAAMGRLGLDEAAVAADPATRSQGVDGSPGFGHLHRFETVRIGPLTFHRVRIDVGSTHLSVGDMLLGEDFFAHHRVWLSPSTATAFLALPNEVGQ